MGLGVSWMRTKNSLVCLSQHARIIRYIIFTRLQNIPWEPVSPSTADSIVGAIARDEPEKHLTMTCSSLRRHLWLQGWLARTCYIASPQCIWSADTRFACCRQTQLSSKLRVFHQRVLRSVLLPRGPVREQMRIEVRCQTLAALLYSSLQHAGLCTHPVKPQPCSGLLLPAQILVQEAQTTAQCELKGLCIGRAERVEKQAYIFVITWAFVSVFLMFLSLTYSITIGHIILF